MGLEKVETLSKFFTRTQNGFTKVTFHPSSLALCFSMSNLFFRKSRPPVYGESQSGTSTCHPVATFPDEWEQAFQKCVVNNSIANMIAVNYELKHKKETETSAPYHSATLNNAKHDINLE